MRILRIALDSGEVSLCRTQFWSGKRAKSGSPLRFSSPPPKRIRDDLRSAYDSFVAAFREAAEKPL